MVGPYIIHVHQPDRLAESIKSTFKNIPSDSTEQRTRGLSTAASMALLVHNAR